MIIDANKIEYKELNKYIQTIDEESISIENVIGQRYIGAGVKGKKIVIKGTPGNALGAYLDNSEIFVYGNGQDATGDTMNKGLIIIYGNVGDATGYSMRGGEIYIKENAGYRVGIHMKEFKDQKPAIIVGGTVGQFLGEYQAGGIIIVLGINCNGQWPVGDFCGTGIHGGNIYVRANKKPTSLSKNVVCEELNDINEISSYLKKYSNYFYKDIYTSLINSKFYKISPNRENPYRQLYVEN